MAESLRSCKCVALASHPEAFAHVSCKGWEGSWRRRCFSFLKQACISSHCLQSPITLGFWT